MSETDFLKLKKHDNVETNTEKFDIENYLNGNWDKINENAKKVNTDILNINLKNKEQDTNIEQLQENTETSSNKIAELEKELKEAQEDFYQASIRGQASGEYIHVEDSSNCRAKIGIGGNSEQETRSGKNYLNTLAKYKAGDTVTVEGITYTFNNDGSITCNGTASADSILDISQNIQKINGTNKKIAGLLTGSQVPSKITLLSYTSNFDTTTGLILSEVNKSLQVKMQENKDYITFRIIVYRGTTVNNQTVYYQILDASETDLTYEQHGVSPSPGYSSEVETVGDNLNLLDIDKTTYDLTINLQKEGEYLKGNNVNIIRIGTFNDSRPQIEEKLKSGNYTISYEVEANSNVTILNLFLCVIYEDDTQENVGSGKSYSLEEGTKQKVFWTLNVQKNVKKMGIVSYLSNSCDIIVSKVKIEKGKVATPWSPYGQGCVKVIKCNKQLFDKNKALQKYEISGITGNVSANDLYFVTDYIRVNANEQYYLSGKLTGNSNCFYDKNKKFISTVNLENGLLTVPNNPNIYYLRFNSRLTAIDTTMLEKNTKKSAFEQHEGQSYIMPTQQSFKSVRDIRDTFIKKDGKWYERHNIYRYLFTGNENFKILDSNSKFGMIVTKNKAKIVSKNDDGNLTYCLSNRFVNNTQFNATKMSNKIAFSQWSDTQYLYLSKIKDSVDELKNYLAANETYVDYPLETPIDLECTEEQSKILDELNNARTYKNVTNITTDSKAILSLDYVKDQETQNQKMQNEIDEIKQLLSTTQTSAMLLDNLQKEVESEVE